MLAADTFHTFAEWKRMGYSVKKGQHAALTCQLWKYTDKPGTAAREAAEELAERCHAEVVQVIGRKFSLYRESSRKDIEKIKLV